MSYVCQSMVAPLRRVIVKRPEEAFLDEAQVDAQWRTLGYLDRPDLARAGDEHRRFVSLLHEAGADVIPLPADLRTGLDSLYTHDPVAAVTERGVILARMGKEARRGETDAMADAFARLGIPVLGRIHEPGTIEGGDVLWLDRQTVAVGRTYRTNADGIRQFRTLLAPLDVEVIDVPLVHWDGPGAVLHLMSIISLLDDDLAVVYDRLLPIPFRELLLHRRVQMVSLPQEEYDSIGCNVLAVAPRRCLMLSGNPKTAQRLRQAGCEVQEFDGADICLKGSGGPTCLTRPVWRE